MNAISDVRDALAMAMREYVPQPAGTAAAERSGAAVIDAALASLDEIEQAALAVIAECREGPWWRPNAATLNHLQVVLGTRRAPKPKPDGGHIHG